MNVNAALKYNQNIRLLYILAAFVLYAQSFNFNWTYDDFQIIVDNPDIRSWGAFLENQFHSRPLRELTYLLDYRLFGLNPFGWHIQNIFWHGIKFQVCMQVQVWVGPR